MLGPGLGLCLATAALLAAGAGCGPESLAPPRLLGMEPDGRASYEELAVQILGQGFTPLLQLSPAGDVRLQAAFSAWLVGPSGEVPLQQVRYLSAERLQAVVPAGLPRPEGGGVDLLLPGPYRLVLHTPQGGVLVLKKAFEVRLPPQLFAIRPSRRSTPQGGGPIELEGRHFVPGSAAWIGAASVLEQELASPELIRGRVPPGQPGVVDVKVVSPYGEAVLPHSFTYVALASLPTVLGVEPRRGSIAGATPIRVWGTGFDAATMVTIAGRPLVEPRLVVQGSGREIHGLTPAGKAGPATVAATNASGSGPGLIDAFFFESPARLEAIVPAAGPQWGGTRVVLHGDGFGPGMRVLLGGAELDDLAVQDARTASGTTPPGRGSVLATVFAGGEAHTLVDGFRYLPPPTLSMVNPASGPALGPGDPSGEVVLHGSGFSVAGLAVSLGGRQPPWLQVVDDHRLRLRLPSGSGPVDLVLRTELGVASLPGAYTYREPPRVDLLVPGRGRPGELVEVHGEHLGDDPQAALGDAAQGMAPLRQSSGGPSLLSGRIPEVRGLVSLLVSSRHGSLTMPRALLVLEPAAAPQLRGALPLVAAEQGGLPFALLGERFPAAARVTIGGRELGEPWRIGDHALLGLLPPGEGDAPIVVSAPGWSAQLPQPLRYESDAPPLLSAVVPPLLGEQPGTLLRIFGANLAPGVRITLGGLALLDLVQVSAEELRGRDPGGPAGPVVLLGETDRGLVARDDLLERVADAAGGGGSGPGPLLFAVEPERGPIGGGFPLTIIGFGLEQVVAARLGGVPVTALQRAGPGRLQGRAPAGVPGRAALTVELAGGQQGPLLEEAFAYRPDEELLLVAVEPAQGLEGGGTPLLVHGGGFTSRTRLFLAGVPLLEQRFGDARTIVARSPPGLPGHAGLTASRDGSEVSLPLAFHYLPAVPLRLSGIQPAEGAAEGGTEVLVEGQGFAAATRILLGGRALLDARVEGGQRVRGRTPPGRGPATLRAEAAGVAVELPAAYRFVAVAERPRISVCEPGWASAAGGTLLRLLGSSLERVVSARLGDRPLGELALVDGHTLLARSPALPAGGELDLLLSDVQGEAGHLPAALRVIAPPRLE
ncbi:MAG: hypothetical protein FJ125_04675, partial [Deltaproteobacteria bacterium]|nr:hypothetical protein [Deltaproteobacteria bacterium]